MPKVTRTILIKAPPAAVWRWMAGEAALRRWLAPDLTIDLRPGGAYRFFGPDGATTITGVVLELEPERELALSWMEEGQGWTHPARLVLALAPAPGGTEVTLIHDGFAGIGRPGWPGTVENYERGADRHRVLEALADLIAVDA
jgi:uncharacterized protein YndB with AHSA1/START domain